MQIPNTQDLQQISLNYTSYIDFKDIINFYKKCNVNPCSFLVIDTTLTSDNLFYFRNNFWKNIKMTMIINDKKRDEKLQHVINKEAAEASVLSLAGKIGKYEYLPGEKIWSK